MAKPLVQRGFIQGVEKFVHVENAGRLDQNTVEVLHPQCDQLRLEPPLVAVRISPAGDHLQPAVLTLQIL